VLVGGVGEALEACPALQRLRLSGVTFPWAEHPWCPDLPLGLTRLELASSYGCNFLRIHASALARLPNLQQLALKDDLVEPPAAGAPPPGPPRLFDFAFKNSMVGLGRLASLRGLRLEYDGDIGWPAFSDSLSELAPLAGLTSLVLEGCFLEPAAWATFAQLPLLACLELECMDAPPRPWQQRHPWQR
jgi:hypothetical protein